MSIEPITIPMSIETNDVTIESTFDARIEVVEGGSITVESLSVNTNGTTTAPAGKAYSPVIVNVPASAVDSGTKNITSNGNNQDVVGYAKVNVAVPNSYSAGDEGKVVSSGALVSQTAHADVTPTTSDQTIDTTTNNSIKVKGDADLVAGNIKKDVEIFGVTGTYEGGGVVDNSLLENTFSADYVNNTATSLSTQVFRKNSRIKTVSMPLATSIVTEAFYQSSALTGVHFPEATSINGNAFFQCTGIVNPVAFPKYGGTNQYAFGQMTKVTGIDLGGTGGLAKGLFQNCNSMTFLILRSTSRKALNNPDAFSQTKFANGGAGGTIYIPKVLYDHLGDGTSYDYEAATNWSTINGYGTITWAKIEGSQYENYYADGTPVVSS